MATPVLAQEKSASPHSGKDAPQKQLAGTIHIALPTLNCTDCYESALLIYSEAFGRLGYTVELHTFPYERCLLETNSGRMDVEAGRIRLTETLAARYPNLVRVDEPIRTVHIVAYTLDATLHLADWQNLTDQKLTIGFSRGIKLIEQRLAQQQVAAQHIRKATDLRQGARMLKRRRLDVLLTLKLPMADLLKEPEFAHTGIRLAGILEQIPVFPYVHQKHRALAPRLAEVLRAMKADGTYARLLLELKSKE